MRTCALALLVCLLSATALAQGDGQPRLHSVQAAFVQEKHLKILVKPLVSTGTFAFQTPHSLRWEYRSPVRSLLLMHEGRIRKLIEREGRLEPDNGAGVEAMQVVFQDLGSWLDGRFENNPMFVATRPDARTIVLTPKEEGLRAMISRIELHLSEQAGVMERVVIVEGEAGATELRFTGAVVNRDIPVSVFTEP